MELPLQITLLALLIKCSRPCENGQLLRTGVSCEEVVEILDVHNRYRQAVALGNIKNLPEAVDMMQITWNEELAYLAQNWANNCRFAHDYQLLRKTRNPIGQNVAFAWWSPYPNEKEDKAEWSDQIRFWFNEVYTNYYNGKYSEQIGHFTQLIWGETNQVGCGYSYYNTGQNFSKLYVCNYAPGGNVIGRHPYQQGPHDCTKPNTFRSRSYWGICEVEGHDAVPPQCATTLLLK